MTDLQLLQKTVSNCKRILVVTGAGISTSSGIQDFKSAYATQPSLKNALSKKSYVSHTDTLAKFLLSFYTHDATPSITHKFLSYLASSRKLLRCYTMNIDGLEIKAGVPLHLVFHVHGSIMSGGKCARKNLNIDEMKDIILNNRMDEYNSSHNCVLRPNIVMYDENAKHMDMIQHDLHNCDLILCFGTRLNVDPIATTINNCPKKKFLINNESLRDFSGIQIIGDCDEICQYLLENLVKFKETKFV